MAKFHRETYSLSMKDNSSQLEKNCHKTNKSCCLVCREQITHSSTSDARRRMRTCEYLICQRVWCWISNLSSQETRAILLLEHCAIKPGQKRKKAIGLQKSLAYLKSYSRRFVSNFNCVSRPCAGRPAGDWHCQVSVGSSRSNNCAAGNQANCRSPTNSYLIPLWHVTPRLTHTIISFHAYTRLFALERQEIVHFDVHLQLLLMKMYCWRWPRLQIGAASRKRSLSRRENCSSHAYGHKGWTINYFSICHSLHHADGAERLLITARLSKCSITGHCTRQWRSFKLERTPAADIRDLTIICPLKLNTFVNCHRTHTHIAMLLKCRAYIFSMRAVLIIIA